MKKIPIHLLIKDPNLLNHNKNDIINEINTKEINYIWYPINIIEDLEIIKQYEFLLSSSFVWFIKDPTLFSKIINENKLNIALSFELFEDPQFLKSFRDKIKRYKSKIYLFNEETFKQSIDRLKLIDEIKKLMEKLKGWGVNNINLLIDHYDLVEHMEIYRRLSEEIDANYIVIFKSYNSEDEKILKNSLLIGNLFYERIVSSILVEYEDVRDFLENINKDIDLIKIILNSLGLEKVGYTIISCPKCGRSQIDLLEINRKVDEYLKKLEISYIKKGIRLADIGGIKVAVMGCNVNGPGEAKGADIGLAGGKNGRITIFKDGIPLETLPEDKVLDRFLEHVENLIDEKLAQSGMNI